MNKHNDGIPLITGNREPDRMLEDRFAWIEKKLTFFCDEIESCNNRVTSVHMDLCDYAEEHPKSKLEFIEERLIALEASIKELKGKKK